MNGINMTAAAESTLYFDAHVHLYPVYDLSLAISAGLLRMEAAGVPKEAVRLWLLSERADCEAFDQLRESAQVGMYRVQRCAEPEALALFLGERRVLTILAGRQIVSRDGLEIAALASLFRLEDRQLDAAAGIDAALAAGALVSLNWAPGKWFGRRGRIVAGLLSGAPRPGLLIGDSAMRPRLWGEPILMRQARRRGWQVIAGSDPLPFAGEEHSIGRYGSRLEGVWDEEHPAASLRRLLGAAAPGLTFWGGRRGPFEFARRQLAIMGEKKSRQI